MSVPMAEEQSFRDTMFSSSSSPLLTHSALPDSVLIQLSTLSVRRSATFQVLFLEAWTQTRLYKTSLVLLSIPERTKTSMAIPSFHGQRNMDPILSAQNQTTSPASLDGTLVIS